MAMNVPAQRHRHVQGQVGRADHIRPRAEREVSRATGRALDTLVEAQHADIHGGGAATRSSEYLRKATANIVCVWEPYERDADSACVDHDGARPIENMQVLIHRKQRIGHAAPFMIPGNEQDRHARRCEALEWRE
jgi:hypothetical protein